jgi:hypothetical protein
VTRRACRRWLLLTLAFVVPLPFFLVETGAVPAVRLLMLAGIHLAVVVAEGPQGAVGIAAVMLVVQLLVYGLLLWLLARILARALAALAGRRLGIATALVMVAAFGAASAFDLYHTPFRTDSLRGNLFDVFD